MVLVFLCMTLCFILHLYGRQVSAISLDISADDPDLFRNVSELITRKGYPLEEHTVETSDGYLLSVQRIPHGRNSMLDGHEREVALLIHGIMADATLWVINYPDQSLGFALPDEGYDVWLLNTRGCKYSRKHLIYTENQYNFWNFSFDEVAQFDIPATIDYILKTTQKEDLYVIGHSQGAGAVFSMLSEMPSYNDKVKLFVALAPATFIGTMTSLARALVQFSDEILFAYNLLNHGECSLDKKVLKPLILAFAEMDEEQPSRFDVFAAHYPSSTSAKSLYHFGQLIKSKKFRKYDYGRRLNLEWYHQEEPPDYDVSLITAPVALFWSKSDNLVNHEDVAILRGHLNSLVWNYCVPSPYTHADYLIALNARHFIVEPVLNLLAKYRNAVGSNDVVSK